MLFGNVLPSVNVALVTAKPCSCALAPPATSSIAAAAVHGAPRRTAPDESTCITQFPDTSLFMTALPGCCDWIVVLVDARSRVRLSRHPGIDRWLALVRFARSKYLAGDPAL